MTDAIVPSELAAAAIKELLDSEFIDRTLKIDRDENSVKIPLSAENLPIDIIRKYRISLRESDHRHRTQREIPFTAVRNRLHQSGFNESELNALPNKWELLGDVLIIRIPQELIDKRQLVAKAYANILGAKTVLRDLGEITGTERHPKMEIIYGEDTETVHIENGVKYCLDASKIMFSSGNIDERIRVASIHCRDNIVLDMFAGIGYFSLPLAVYGKPKKIFSCEVRRLSYDYLRKNIEINGVEKIIDPILGDNRDFDPPYESDLIVMGYLKDTHAFLPKALNCLKDGGRIIYHENCPNELFPARTIQRLSEAAGKNRDFNVLNSRIVKSFAPGVSHVVFDVRFTRT